MVNKHTNNTIMLREGLKKKKKKSWLLTKKGGGGWRKNQLANLIFYFSTNNEYGI